MSKAYVGEKTPSSINDAGKQIIHMYKNGHKFLSYILYENQFQMEQRL